MQEELTALQPELIQTSAETDKMMVKIEGETVEVDAKKELVSADEKVANEAAAAAKAIKVFMYFRNHCKNAGNLLFKYFFLKYICQLFPRCSKLYTRYSDYFHLHQTLINVYLFVFQDECEGDLAEAMPALEAALSALDTLKPADITVVKSMQNPPGLVKLVMESICVMKGIKPERKPDPSGSGRIRAFKESFCIWHHSQ